MKNPFLNTVALLSFFLLCSFTTIDLQKQPLYSKQKIALYINEVFADQADALVFKSSSKRLPLITDFFNRISIQNMPEHRGKKFKLLSSLELLDKYNPNLTRDKNFDPENFNALKYQFDMVCKNKLVYRVDNTDYIISIEPLK